ncbi:MAG: NAD(P)/FAD-dependent oxidoreductase [Pseudonocardiaceae bacterium]
MTDDRRFELMGRMRGDAGATAEYVVVGAGITGAAVAAHLARHGAAPLILEADVPARGATGASGGMVRGYDPDPVVARYAAASLAIYADPAVWCSVTAPLHRTGAVTLASVEHAAELDRAAEALRATVGADCRVVSGEDVSQVHGVHTADGVALVEPGAGWVDPVQVTELFVRQAVRDGARLANGVQLTAIRQADDGVLLESTQGAAHAIRAVVLAIGGWAARPPIGVRAPRVGVRTRAIQASLLRRPTGARPHTTFIDLRTGGYGKPVDEHTSLVGAPLLVWDEDPCSDTSPDAEHHQHTLDVVRRNLPWIPSAETVRMVRSFDGYATADTPLIPTELPRVWYTRMGSGGGVKVAPELGREIAERLLSQPCPATPPSGRQPSQRRGTDAALP